MQSYPCILPDVIPVRQTRSLPTDFLQIPPRRGHPCLRLCTFRYLDVLGTLTRQIIPMPGAHKKVDLGSTFIFHIIYRELVFHSFLTLFTTTTSADFLYSMFTSRSTFGIEYKTSPGKVYYLPFHLSATFTTYVFFLCSYWTLTCYAVLSLYPA